MSLVRIIANEPGHQVQSRGAGGVRPAGDATTTVVNPADAVPLLGARQPQSEVPSTMLTIEVAPGDVRKFSRADAIALGLIDDDEEADR